MSVEDETLNEDAQGPRPLTFTPRERRRPSLRRALLRRRNRPPRPRVRKLRLFCVLAAFLGLAAISTLFGMLTALASDLPQLENRVEFRASVDSYLYDDTGAPIGPLVSPDEHVIDNWYQISPYMRDAVVAVEDKRYWSSPGIDIRGLLRAAVSDLTGGPTEGGSTIPEEFVKNVEQAEDHRTIFEKLREAGLAFQLVHKWKLKKILVEYLNTIYFGNGANGIESAARIYFGSDYGYNPSDPGAPGGCGDPDATDKNRKECAAMLTPAQSALLAGMVANPTEFNPITHPQQARGRRQVVLEDMLQQHYIDRAQYNIANAAPLPTKLEQLQQEPSAAPYFTAWVTPLIVRALEKEGVHPASLAEHEAYYGGLKIKLTINLKMQEAAQDAVDAEFPPGSDGPTASLVAIDNNTGEVRAMVSGDGNYEQSPFNLAAFGYRQPGSSFKLFTLAAALSSGKYGPDSVIDSKPLSVPFHPPGSTKGYIGHFVVHNFGNVYAGPTTLATATATSDNSVFTQIGMSVGTKKIKQYAKAMGIRSPISTTPAMILGGLNTGVSALDMAHAYETVATGGLKVYNRTLGDYDEGPIGIHSISGCAPCKQHTITNIPRKRRVISPEVADTITELLHGPVDDSYGTGTAAAIPGVDVAGKTGTTSNYVDAWFVGYTPQMTIAVWVGYPSSGKPMLTNFNGGPVEGGTFPAIIFHNAMEAMLGILQQEQQGKSGSAVTTPSQVDVYTGTTTIGTEPGTATGAQTDTTAAGTTATTPAAGTGATTTPAAGTGGATGGGTGGGTTTPSGTGTPTGTTSGTTGGTGLP